MKRTFFFMVLCSALVIFPAIGHAAAVIDSWALGDLLSLPEAIHAGANKDVGNAKGDAALRLAKIMKNNDVITMLGGATGR